MAFHLFHVEHRPTVNWRTVFRNISNRLPQLPRAGGWLSPASSEERPARRWTRPCPKEEKQPSRLDKRLDLRQRLSVDPNGPHRHEVDSVVQRRPGEQLLESNGIDRRASKSELRTASRRNTAFRVLDSTIRSDIPGAANFIGIAGDPPPDPMSRTSASGLGRYLAATTGSTSSLSMASVAFVINRQGGQGDLAVPFLEQLEIALEASDASLG